MMSRRNVVKFLASIPVMTYLHSIIGLENGRSLKAAPLQVPATIYKATGPDPGNITRRLLDSIGGIQSLIDKEDIVILKPNSQQWHQGMTNTDVMAEFIKTVLSIPGFKGEIIIADNNQSKEPNSGSWTTEHRNGRFNLNELVQYFNNAGHENITKYHWHPAGPNPTPLQGGGHGDSVINHPSEGDGYIWPEDLYYECPHGHKCVLAYPVFTSSYSGVTVDLKDGAFKDNKYTGQPVKFINFSALNHHSSYAGVTASVKNFMGVVDMSCGYPAPKPIGTYNTHHIGATIIFKFLANIRKHLERFPYFWDIHFHNSVFRFKYTGGVLGKFMSEIRKADLNIITAINIGWGARTDPAMAYKANIVLASTDPVALDYWAAANILLPATMDVGAPENFIKANDPGLKDGNFRHFLEECRKELGGTTDPNYMSVIGS